MGGQALRLGPFVGGLNTTSDPTAIADAELAQCANFELDIDGSLISRPPFKEVDGHASWTERIVCIGEAIFSGVNYLIGSNANGVFYRISGDVQPWVLITSTIQSTCCTQYADFLYIVAIPGSANPGGKWSPGGGFSGVAAIPKGMACTIHKERLFVVPGVLATSNASRLSFSNAGNFDTWGGSDFIDVKQGDGSNLIDLTVFQDNLLLFKTKSSHVLAYDTRPTDAVLREISKTIGVDRQFNMVNYENQVYIFHGGWVYEIVNYDFSRLNTKVPFLTDDTAPSAFASELIFLSMLGDRLICRFHRNIYVYGMRTRTWSEWESVQNKLHYFGPIVTIHPPTGNEYYGGSCLTLGLTCVRLFEKIESTTKEQVVLPLNSLERDTFTRVTSNGWGTSETGQTYTLSGGVVGDYNTTGTVATINLTSANVSREVTVVGLSRADQDILCTISVNKIPATSDVALQARARYVDASNHYVFSFEFMTSGSTRVVLTKIVAGAPTVLGTFTAGTFIANDQYTYRISLNGTAVRCKYWKTSGTEPGGWGLNFIDAGVTAAGGLLLYNIALTGTSNLPIVASFDNLVISDPDDTISLITCVAQTKNFDMATSHTYKRLWWWGADVTTDNDIMGTATPIVFSFNVTWATLAAYRWNELNTWAQPLTEISSITTTQVTDTGTARRFAKFLKGLRYRQIHFAVTLTTEGSTIDGPARIFTMTIFTESKEKVTKGVN